MIANRDDIVAEARQWLGTPFHHQGRTRGVGVDCIGIIAGVAQSLALTDICGTPLTAYDQQDYGPLPLDGALETVLEQVLESVAIDALQPGDLALFRFYQHPQHVGIVSEHLHGGLGIIHALQTVGKVAEHRLDTTWKRRLVGGYHLIGTL